MLKGTLSTKFLILVLAFSAHNIEESVLGLADWMAASGGNSDQVEEARFQLALVMVTTLAWLIYFWVRSSQPQPARCWVAGLVAAALLTNSISHIGYTLATQTLMPGVVTATLLMGPISLLVLLDSAEQLRLRTPQRLLMFGGGLLLHFITIVATLALASIFLA